VLPDAEEAGEQIDWKFLYLRVTPEGILADLDQAYGSAKAKLNTVEHVERKRRGVPGTGVLVRWVLVLGLLALVAIPALAAVSTSGQPTSAGATAALTWTQVHSAPAVHWNKIYFVDRNVGYAVGGYDWDVYPSGANASFAKTTDGGQTWTTQTIPGSRHFMIGVTCLDAQQCWVAGTNQMWRTTDGGATWSGLGNAGYAGWFWSAEVISSPLTVLVGTTGYAADATPNPLLANFLRSTNGTYFQMTGTDGTLVQWDIECEAGGICNSAARSSLYRSTNYGANWSRLRITDPALAGRYYGLSCTSANTCWMVGKRDSDTTGIFNPVIYTNNGGASWIRSNVSGLPARTMLWDVEMVDNQHGYAVGCDDVNLLEEKCSESGQGTIVQTIDGYNWGVIPAPKTADAAKPAGISDLWVFGMDDIYILDWEGNIWHGTIPPTPTPTPTNTATLTPTATSTFTPTPSTGQVNGIVFHDRNGDAWRDPDEPGLAGAGLALRQGANVAYTAVSDDGGHFQFLAVAPGQYTLVSNAAPAGYLASAVAIAFEVAANRNFTFYPGYQLEPTPTATATTTATAIPTETAMPTATVTLTMTPTATATATPTSTPSPEVRQVYMPVMLR